MKRGSLDRGVRKNVVVVIGIILIGMFFYFSGETGFGELFTGLAVGDDLDQPIGATAAGENINISTDTEWNTSQVYDNIWVTNGATLIINNSVENVTINISAANITVESGSYISADGTGYYGITGDDTTPGGGPSPGGTNGVTNGGSGGGAHGGQGGKGGGGCG
tara:strand:+ start:56 stop:547 length:492 start_codon:yes stop_codon:yes gene_type:complete